MLPKDSIAAPEWEVNVVRLALAIALSLALHVAIIFGIKVGVSGKIAPQSYIIQARLEESLPSKRSEMSVRKEGGKAALAKALPDRKEIPENKPVPQAQATPPSQSIAQQHIVKQPDIPAQETGAKVPALNIPAPDDETYYSAKEVDMHPSVITPIHFDYPEKALENNIEGDVVVLMLIDEKGVIRDISIQEVDPPGYSFEKSVLNAFQGAVFRPAIRHGREVKSRVRYSIHFGS